MHNGRETVSILRALFYWLTSRRIAPETSFAMWLDIAENERRERIIVHKVKTEWIFSGTVRNDKGAMQDAGYLRSPDRKNRKQALRYFARMFPRGNLIHVDDKNKIIKYTFF